MFRLLLYRFTINLDCFSLKTVIYYLSGGHDYESKRTFNLVKRLVANVRCAGLVSLFRTGTEYGLHFGGVGSESGAFVLALSAFYLDSLYSDLYGAVSGMDDF